MNQLKLGLLTLLIPVLVLVGCSENLSDNQTKNREDRCQVILNADSLNELIKNDNIITHGYYDKEDNLITHIPLFDTITLKMNCLTNEDFYFSIDRYSSNFNLIKSGKNIFSFSVTDSVEKEFSYAVYLKSDKHCFIKNGNEVVNELFIFKKGKMLN